MADNILLLVAQQHERLVDLKKELLDSGYKIVKVYLFSILADRHGSRRRFCVSEFDDYR
jgi:hypothetical protein